jgi:hypothetical protein
LTKIIILDVMIGLVVFPDLFIKLLIKVIVVILVKAFNFQEKFLKILKIKKIRLFINLDLYHSLVKSVRVKFKHKPRDIRLRKRQKS